MFSFFFYVVSYCMHPLWTFLDSISIIVCALLVVCVDTLLIQPFQEYFYVWILHFICIDHINDISLNFFSFIYVETCFNKQNMTECTFKIPL